jgi:hypothetical protein
MLPVLVVYLQFLSVVLTTDPIPIAKNEFSYSLLVLSYNALHKTPKILTSGMLHNVVLARTNVWRNVKPPSSG